MNRGTIQNLFYFLIGCLIGSQIKQICRVILKLLKHLNQLEQNQMIQSNPIQEGVAEQIKTQIRSFVQTVGLRRVAIITSGGTTVPLEQRCVRFIDNFSAGQRGARSTEEFLQEGYVVILLRRKGSIKPFQEIYPCIEDLQSKPIQTNLDLQQQKLKVLCDKFEDLQNNNQLLQIEFQSVFEYLKYLQLIAEEVRQLGDRVVFFLAAAVSDFFVPWEKLPEHKVQSGNGALNLNLQQVPKMLGVLKRDWASEAFVVSFKLETDEEILIRKAQLAADKYNVDAVVANLLHTRKDRVMVLSSKQHEWCTIDRNTLDRIETPLVKYIVKLHTSFTNTG
eukprot:TRINITY_DN13818_c1_g2_i3.p2 TRINITY_DN13818_c1_g2~~TRINITY_DN13818_c1_g2_i3.p2  ORF type:complete len:335 (+),score=32.22 TRINITY_DN13818_c1_g2_i3:104-1108(+)